jgi:hypothetical protein
MFCGRRHGNYREQDLDRESLGRTGKPDGDDEDETGVPESSRLGDV